MRAKFVNNFLNENIKFEGHDYVKINLHGDHIYASPEGILGDHQTFISWDEIRELMKKFDKK